MLTILIVCIFIATCSATFYLGTVYEQNRLCPHVQALQQERLRQNVEIEKLHRQTEDLKRTITGEVTAVEVEMNI